MYRLAISGVVESTKYPFLKPYSARTTPSSTSHTSGSSTTNPGATLIVDIAKQITLSTAEVRKSIEKQTTLKDLREIPDETIVAGFVAFYERSSQGRSWFDTGTTISSPQHRADSGQRHSTGGLGETKSEEEIGKLVCVELAQKYLRQEFASDPDQAHALLNDPLVRPTPGPSTFLCLLGVPTSVCALSLLATAGVSLTAPSQPNQEGKQDIKDAHPSRKASPSDTSRPHTRILRVINPITSQSVLILGFETPSAARVFSARWHGNMIPTEAACPANPSVPLVADKAVYVAELETITWHALPSTLVSAAVAPFLSSRHQVGSGSTTFGSKWHIARKAFRAVFLALTGALIQASRHGQGSGTLPAVDDCVPACPECLENLDADVAAGGCSLVPASALALPSTVGPDSYLSISMRAALASLHTPAKKGHASQQSSKPTYDQRSWGCFICWIRKHGGVPDRFVGEGDANEHSDAATKELLGTTPSAEVERDVIISEGDCDDCLETPEYLEDLSAGHASRIASLGGASGASYGLLEGHRGLDLLQNSRWICLVCAHIACPRYQAAHALQHGINCRHQHAMDTSRAVIWSYRRDGYCQRIVPASASLAAATAAAAAATGPSRRTASSQTEITPARSSGTALSGTRASHSSPPSQSEEKAEVKRTTSGVSIDSSISSTPETAEDELLASAHPTFKGDYLSPERQLDGLIAAKLKSINSHYAELLDRQLSEQLAKFEEAKSKFEQESSEERLQQERAIEEARLKAKQLENERLKMEAAIRESIARCNALKSQATPIRASTELLRSYAKGQLLDEHRKRIATASAVVESFAAHDSVQNAIASENKTLAGEVKAATGSTTGLTRTNSLTSTERREAKANENASFAKRVAKLRTSIEEKERIIETLNKLIAEEMATLDKLNRVSHPTSEDSTGVSTGAAAASVRSPKSSSANFAGGTPTKQSMTADEALATADAIRELLELEGSEPGQGGGTKRGAGSGGKGRRSHGKK